MTKPLLLRTLALSLIFTVGSLNLHSQWVTIPDAAFANHLQITFPGCMSGNMLDTTCTAVVSATGLYCANKGISDLTGVQYFDNLSVLYCAQNLLTDLPDLPVFLTELRCSENQIAALPDLPVNLIELDCAFNWLDALPALPDSLTRLYCYSNALTALPALPAGLIDLECSGNELTSLPFLPSGLLLLGCGSNFLNSLPTLPPGLLELYCDQNSIAALPTLPGSINWLFCDFNELTSLPTLPNSLIYLNCNNNQLTSLPALPAPLKELYCDYNLLTALPSLPVGLEKLHCRENQLAVLPVLQPNLRELYCENNQLTTIPVLHNSLRYLNCSDNMLTSIAGLSDTMSLICYNNPTLFCLPQLKFVYSLNFLNTGITCLPNYPQGNVQSFPALNTVPLCDMFNAQGCDVYWNISGKTYYDDNSNCVADLTDATNTNIKVQLYQGGNLVQQAYTGAEGFYSFDVNNYSTYTCSVDSSNIPFTVSCPASGFRTSNITALDSMDFNMDFALRCKTGFDLKAHCLFADRFRPANFTTVNISAGDATNFYGARCAAGISGAVTVTISGAVSYVSPASGALTPSVSGNVLTYNIADFGNVNFFTDFGFVVQTDTFAALGSQVCFTVAVTPTAGDYNPANNTLTHCFTVVGSYDPNDKAVSPPGNIDTVQEWLTYTVRFQNTGTAEAQHIYITDTLDTDLDVSSFQLLAYSHPPMVQITGNAVRFNYPNINLPDSNTNEPLSHGYVQYRVRLNTNLAIGAEVNNTAFIYFDFNAPVITNTVTNTVVDTTGTGTCLPTSANITDTICNNELYFFGGALITAGGVYYDTIPNSNGCDSVIQLILTVYTANDVFLTASICEGDTFVFGSQLLDTAGVYYELYTNTNGCDSFIELTLTVHPPTSSAITASICDNEVYPFGAQLLNNGGVYYDTLTNSNGCDSVVELTLTVLATSGSSISASICNGDVYSFGAQLLNSAGVYYDTLTNSNNCDSVVELTLTVRATSGSSMSASICSGNTYSFGTQLLNSSGVYYDTLTNSNNCDSIVQLTLTVLPALQTSIADTICEYETYLFAGQSLNVSGVYTDTLSNANNCDSVVILTLTVDTFLKSNITRAICEGESFGFGGVNLTQAGTYYDTVSSGVQSCDMIVTLQLSVLSATAIIIDTAIAQGSVYTLPSGATATTAGTYIDTLVGSNTCDSIVTVNLTVISGITKSEIANPKFEMFPNPASDVVTISMDEYFVGSVATITDITGRKVVIVPLSTVNCPLSTTSFESGVYFVTVTDKENRTATKRLVISR